MAKRGATTDLNHDNWDEPLEEEEAGSFKAASESDLRNRVIKTAKRRIKPAEGTEKGSSVFASFGGFKPPTSTSSKANQVFGFLGGAKTNNGTPLANKLGVSSSQQANGKVGFSSTPQSDLKDNQKEPAMQSAAQEKYLSKLKELNRSVLDWLKTHIETNPYCILTPVFNDYEKYLKQLREERDAAEKAVPASSAPASLASFNFVSSSTGGNKYTITMPPTDAKQTTSSSSNDKPSVPTFGVTSDSGKSPLLQGNDASKTPAPSIFGSIASDTSKSSFFTKPDPASLMVNPFTSVLNKDSNSQTGTFSFSNGATAKSSDTVEEKEDDEESEEPPKVEFTPVEEEGALFSSRCKVFVKKDANYKERGVGTLYIKKVGESKHQLLVRAETVLGNVVLNVLLTSSIPTERKGTNNVMLVCVPTPQDPPPPTVVLLRVKTAQEADQLLDAIKKYQS